MSARPVTWRLRVLRLIRSLLRRCNARAPAWRGAGVRFYIRLMGGQCGPGLRVRGAVNFKQPPHWGYTLGRDVRIAQGVTFDIRPDATLIIGDRVNFAGPAVVAAIDRIEIGADTLLAEFVSIRDADHGTEAGSLIAGQRPVIAPVRIGSDVWIGRGAAVLRGSTLGDGAVVGANAVVKAAVAAGDIVAGVPARRIGRRRSASGPSSETGRME